MQAMRERRITPRQTMLLGHVDHWCNPFWTRHPEAEHDDSERDDSRLFRADYLRSILNATNNTVRSSIIDLKRKRPSLLKARKLGQSWWQLKTRARSAEAKDGSVFLPPPIRRGFEAGELTPEETLFLSHVASFTRCGSLCYLTNKRLGKFLGVKSARVVQIIGRLVGEGLLVAELLTHDELRKKVAEHEGFLPAGFRRKGRRTSRLLWPTDGRLYRRTTEWTAVPESVEWPEDENENDDD